MVADERHFRKAQVALAIALLWSIGLLLFAVLVPTDGSGTLVDESGTGILPVLALPAALTVAAFIALRYERFRGGHASRVAVWLCVSGLFVLTLLGILSVGVFILPVTALVGYAANVSAAPDGIQ
jgi:hypothetical protein